MPASIPTVLKRCRQPWFGATLGSATKDRANSTVHRSRAAAALGRTDQRSHQRTFGVRQITLVTQAAPVGRRSMFRLPHEAPPNQVPSKESQAIPATQVLSGTALRKSGPSGRPFTNSANPSSISWGWSTTSLASFVFTVPASGVIEITQLSPSRRRSCLRS